MRTPVAVLLLALATPAARALDDGAYQAAAALYREGRPMEAQHAFEALALSDPANASVQFYLGRLALQRNDPAQAVSYLEKAASLSPDDSRIRLKLGDAYGLSAQKAGLFSKLSWAGKCLKAYEKAIALDPRNLDARWSLMEFFLQAPPIAGGGADKALIQAREIGKSDAARGRLALAAVHLAGKKPDAAFGAFEEVLATEPDNYEALFQIGRIAAITGERPGQGLAALEKCLHQSAPPGQPSRAEVHWRIGEIREKQGDLDGARAGYEAALQLEPGFPAATAALNRIRPPQPPPR